MNILSRARWVNLLMVRLSSGGCAESVRAGGVWPRPTRVSLRRRTDRSTDYLPTGGGDENGCTATSAALLHLMGV
jgi:hypothetical protein